MIATAKTFEQSGFGTGWVQTTVYLNWTTGSQPPTLILAFSEGPAGPGGMNVGMKWLTPTHLQLTYKRSRPLSTSRPSSSTASTSPCKNCRVHRRTFPDSGLREEIEFCSGLLAADTCTLVHSGERHWDIFVDLCEKERWEISSKTPGTPLWPSSLGGNG